MTRFACLCESCQQGGHLALFRSPVPVQAGSLGEPGVYRYTNAIVLCIGCGIRSGFARWFAEAASPVAKACA